jgi:pectate lyase-like protein
MATNLPWTQYTELVVGLSHPTLTDTDNRALRQLLQRSAFGADGLFDGFPIGSSAVNAGSSDFTQGTAGLRVNAAVARAVVAGKRFCWIPLVAWDGTPMQPFDATAVTFNPAVRMIAEGYNPAEWNVRAYGAAGDGVQNDQTAIVACNAAANAGTLNSLTGGIVKFPAGKYLHTASLQAVIALNQGQVIWRGDGMRTTYLFPSGPSTNFTAAPLYNTCLNFGSMAPDAAGSSTQNTQYCGIEDMSVSGALITSGSVVGVQFTQMQKGWITNHICEAFPNNSIGLYLRGSTVTGGLGTATTAPHTWRCSFSNCVIVNIGSNNLGGQPVLLQNADENYFENCVHGAAISQTVAADSIVTTKIQLGRNNIFVDCLQAGERTALKTGYVGHKFGPPVNEAGGANGSVLANMDFGAVTEGYDICVWFGGDSSGNTLGNQVLGSNPSIYNTAYKDDNPALTNGGFVGGGNGGNAYEAPVVNIMYRAIGGPSVPTCLFANGATTPTVGGSDTWQTANAGGTIITDFLAPAGASLDGRVITVFINDANTTIRDVNNGGGGHIRTWGRQDIIGVVGMVVTFKNIFGTWYQWFPPTTMGNSGTANFQFPVVWASKSVALSEAVLVSGLGAAGAIGNYFSTTLTAARVVGAPLNPIAGQRITNTIIQSGAGAFALTWHAVFKNSWSDVGNATPKRTTISHIYDGTSWNQEGAQTPYV